MNTNPDPHNDGALPWWLQVCRWAWPRLIHMWLIGIVGTCAAAWLTNGRKGLAGLEAQNLLVTLIGAILLGVLTVVIGWGNAIATRRLAVPPTPEQYNRVRFLARLRRHYTDRLEQSLQGATFMALGLAEETNTVLPLPGLRIWSPPSPQSQLPAGTSILQAYDDANGELLILGEPGAGKTTFLLDLAQELLVRTEQDEQHLFPVIFHLSSWAAKQQPLAPWLIEELTLRYGMPRRLSQTLVQNEQILPLLDGLDEVDSSVRVACITAINSYHRAHLTPLVVCSRKKEYRILHERLSLVHAIEVQPLKQQQIETYLKAAGKPLVALHTVLRKNPVLYELARTPLLFNVLILTYRDKSVRSLPKMGTQEEQQRQVFASYVQRMLESQQGRLDYTPQQIQDGLIWLAKKMQQHNQTQFFLEQLQPSWLSSRQRRFYERFAIRFPAFLIGALVGLTAVLAFFKFDIFVLIAVSLISGGLGALLGSSGRTPSSKEGSTTGKHAYHPVIRMFGLGLLAGLMFILSSYYNWQSVLSLNLHHFARDFRPGEAMIHGLIYVLIHGLCCSILALALSNSNRVHRPGLISPGQGWQTWRQYLTHYTFIQNGLLTGLILGLAVTLTTGLGLAAVHGQQVGLLPGLQVGLILGLCWTFVGGLLSLLLAGKMSRFRLTDRIRWSWKKLGYRLFSKHHLSHTLLVSVFSGLSLGLPYGLKVGGPLISWLIVGISTGGLIYWLLIGLFQAVESETLDDQFRVTPGQGLLRSAYNGLILGLASSVICMLIFIVSRAIFKASEAIFKANGAIGAIDMSALIHDLQTYGVSFGLVFGLACGLLVALLKGGLAWLQYATIYLLIWRAGSIPWHYPQFLDAAARCIFLYKEGAGYVFIHRVFLDFFASKDTTEFSRSFPQLLSPHA